MIEERPASGLRREERSKCFKPQTSSEMVLKRGRLRRFLRCPFIKFLGTAGARFVVMKQLRAYRSMWLSVGKTNLYIDPGPGGHWFGVSTANRRLEPSANWMGFSLPINTWIIPGDVNVMVEAMTDGGFKKEESCCSQRCPDPVVLKYLRDYVERVEILKENSEYRLEIFYSPQPKGISIGWRLMVLISRFLLIRFL